MRSFRFSRLSRLSQLSRLSLSFALAASLMIAPAASRLAHANDDTNSTTSNVSTTATATANTTTTASQALTTWTQRLHDASVQQGQPVVLVVHLARDCLYCRRWQATFGGEGDFKKYAKTHPDVRMIVIDRATLSRPEIAEDYPEEVRWLYSKNEQHDALQPGTPLFEVYVAQTPVWRSYGIASWDTAVMPAVKDLDNRRTTAVSSVN
ncbi:hypothetical protein [Paraburkholderia sp.]|uniref:hypothetical protein n=1 Tax=Paraburkholderia sp. TaxID=1926495 RepID=UPI0023A213A9|nr:hypothetical protein [Paraburkholderia sp.]MDE1182419.1 hypothetical protein [Paraburkholderia sp.]